MKVADNWEAVNKAQMDASWGPKGWKDWSGVRLLGKRQWACPHQLEGFGEHCNLH